MVSEAVTGVSSAAETIIQTTDNTAGDILSGNLSGEQNALIRLNLGLPVTAADDEVLGFLDQLAASSNVQLEGHLNGIDLSKIKEGATQTGS